MTARFRGTTGWTKGHTMSSRLLAALILATLPLTCLPHVSVGGSNAVMRHRKNSGLAGGIMGLRGGKGGNVRRGRRVGHPREIIGADGKRDMVMEGNKTNELFETYYRFGLRSLFDMYTPSAH